MVDPVTDFKKRMQWLICRIDWKEAKSMAMLFSLDPPKSCLFIHFSFLLSLPSLKLSFIPLLWISASLTDILTLPLLSSLQLNTVFRLKSLTLISSYDYYWRMLMALPCPHRIVQTPDYPAFAPQWVLFFCAVCSCLQLFHIILIHPTLPLLWNDSLILSITQNSAELAPSLKILCYQSKSLQP